MVWMMQKQVQRVLALVVGWLLVDVGSSVEG